MQSILLFECSIMIQTHVVGVKIYKDGPTNYSFTLSPYFQEDGEIAPYIPGSGSIDTSVEGILFKINLYKKRFNNIKCKVSNSSF